MGNHLRAAHPSSSTKGCSGRSADINRVAEDPPAAAAPVIHVGFDTICARLIDGFDQVIGRRVLDQKLAILYESKFRNPGQFNA